MRCGQCDLCGKLMVCYVPSVRVKLPELHDAKFYNHYNEHRGKKWEHSRLKKFVQENCDCMCSNRAVNFPIARQYYNASTGKKFTMMEFWCNGWIGGDFHVIRARRSFFRAVNPFHMNLRHETSSISCMSRANGCNLAFPDREPISRAFSLSIYVAVRVWAKYCSRHIHAFVSSTDTASNANIYI